MNQHENFTVTNIGSLNIDNLKKNFSYQCTFD